MKNLKKAACLSIIMMLLVGCRQKAETEYQQEKSTAKTTQIGVAWDTFVLERWLRDRDVFVSTATGMGAEVNVQNANGDQEKQIDQIEYLIEKKVDVIVIIAIDTDSDKLRERIKKAKDAGIKIIAYDRFIQGADVDLYISFDNERVGELMAESALDKMEAGSKIAGILGSPTDFNVKEVEAGIDKVLKKSNQELIYKNYATAWRGEYGYEFAEECLDEFGEVDVFICGNDALASEAFKALAERKLVGKVRLIGQDADIDACQRIVGGQQYMTVYKDIQALAKQAAQYAVALGSGKEINTGETVLDGGYEIPVYLLEPIAVTEENIEKEIIDSQFHLRDEVYLHTK